MRPARALSVRPLLRFFDEPLLPLDNACCSRAASKAPIVHRDLYDLDIADVTPAVFKLALDDR